MAGGIAYVDWGRSSSLNVSGAAVRIKPGYGRIGVICMTVSGSTPGAVYDAATTGGAVAGNLIAVIPNAGSSIILNFPFFQGLVVSPGTGQVLSISWS